MTTPRVVRVVHALDELKLIQNIRAHECLYDFDVVRDRKKMFLHRQEAWKQVASAMGASVSECRENWGLIRNAYTHAIARRAKAGLNAEKFTKWMYEDEMSFLLPFIKSRRNRSKHNHMQDINDSESQRKAIKRKVPEHDSLNTQLLRVTAGTTNYKTEVCTLHTDGQEERDDIDLFFESVAKTVKNLPKLERIKLKWDIMKMVNEVEIRYVEGNEEASSTNSTQDIPLDSDIRRDIPAAISPPTALTSSSLFVRSEQTDTLCKQELSEEDASQILKDCKNQLTEGDLLIEADTLTIMGVSKSTSNSNWLNSTAETASNNTIATTNDPDATSNLPCIISVRSFAKCKEGSIEADEELD